MTAKDSIAASFLAGAQEAAESEQLQRITEQRRSYEGVAADQLVPMPGATLARLADIIDHDYMPEDHTSIFSAVEAYLKSPTPGAQYCWAAKDDPNTFGRERRKEYRRVDYSELRDDCPLPLTTHVGPAGEYVCVYDLLLMEMPPDVVRKKRKWPAQGALLRTVRGVPFKTMKEGLHDMTGGGVNASMDITPEGGETIHLE